MRKPTSISLTDACFYRLGVKLGQAITLLERANRCLSPEAPLLQDVRGTIEAVTTSFDELAHDLPLSDVLTRRGHRLLRNAASDWGRWAAAAPADREVPPPARGPLLALRRLVEAATDGRPKLQVWLDLGVEITRLVDATDRRPGGPQASWNSLPWQWLDQGRLKALCARARIKRKHLLPCSDDDLPPFDQRSHPHDLRHWYHIEAGVRKLIRRAKKGASLRSGPPAPSPAPLPPSPPAPAPIPSGKAGSRASVLGPLSPSPPASSTAPQVPARSPAPGPVPSVPASPLPPDEERQYVFRRDGEVWQVRFRNEKGGFPHMEGFKYIAELLCKLNKPVSALTLCGSSDSLDHAHDPQTVLDEQARADYRSRIQELGEEIVRETNANNHNRVKELEEERAFFLKELGSSQGLGGRARTLGSAGPAERAADAIRKAIKRACDKLRERMPELDRHLERSIRHEGNSFAYRPDDPAPDWDL